MKKIMMVLLLISIMLTGCSKKTKVTLDYDNGSESKTIEVEQGKTVNKPEDPVKEGYIFNYWELDYKEYDFNTAVEKDFTLKANYAKLHTVTFKVDDEIIETRLIKDKETVTSEISLPIPLEKEDYDFMGWQWNGKDFDLSAPITNDIELVANYQERVYAKSIKLDEEKIVLEINKTKILGYTLSPSETTETPTYKSENEKIAKVDEDGVITGMGVGETYIVISTKKASTKAKIIVQALAESVSLDKTSLEITVGDTTKLNATIKPDNTSDKTLVFSSSDKSVASVDSKGNVTGNAIGKATISVLTNNGKKATCEVTIKGIEVSGIQLDKTSLMLARDSSISLNVNVAPANATNKNVVFTSTHPEVAAVDANGKVTGIAKGTTTIIATSSNGKTSTCDVEVFVKVDTITVLPTRNHIAYDGIKDVSFSVTVKPADADYSTIGWNATGNVGGQNGAYSFSANGNFATLSARETSRYDTSCGVYAYITNKDGSVTNSNAINITAESALSLTKQAGDNVTWKYEDGKYYAICANHTNLEIKANVNIEASFNSKDYIDQEHYEEDEVWITVANYHSHQEGFQMVLKTPGGQSATVVISVNNN